MCGFRSRLATRSAIEARSVPFQRDAEDSVEFDTEVDGRTGHVPLLVTVY